MLVTEVVATATTAITTPMAEAEDVAIATTLAILHASIVGLTVLALISVQNATQRLLVIRMTPPLRT